MYKQKINYHLTCQESRPKNKDSFLNIDFSIDSERALETYKQVG